MNNNLTPVVKKLLLANIAIFILGEILVSSLGMDISAFLGFRPIGSEYFLPFQVVTYMFLHAGLGHLFSNMLGLYFLGPLLEQVLGAKKFFIYYMIAGIGSGLLFASVNYAQMYGIQKEANSFLANPSPDKLIAFTDNHFNLSSYGYEFTQELYPENPNDETYIQQARVIVRNFVESKQAGVMVGASGAIFGIIIAFGFLFPNLEMMLLFPPIPIKAKYFALLYGIYSIYSLIERNPNDNVAHLAHLGGMLFGFIMLKYWKMKPYN